MSPESYVAYLEARVEALEEALVRRSRDLRILQRHLPEESLVLLSRIRNGLPPLPRQAHELELWNETTELVPADVEESLGDLWRSLTALEEDGDEPA